MNNLENKNIKDLEAFKNLTDEEKALALQILGQMASTGESEILDNLKFSDFEEIPVDIDTFLDDDRYLGKGLWAIDQVTGERRCTLFPYWRETLHKLFPDNLTTNYNTLILTGSIGLGKAQPLTAQVLTENGFKQMQELTLQDRVFGNDGKLHNIIGIFPQGKKKICKVTFSDHTSTLCCDEHLWTVYNIDKKKVETIETREIFKVGLLRNGKNTNNSHNYKIPITQAIAFEKKSLSIPPYILGVLIGDGCLTQHSVQFATTDDEIVENIKKTLADSLEVRKIKSKYVYTICKKKNNTFYDKETKTHKPTPNEYCSAIINYGLNVTAYYKHIPTCYLQSCVQDRIALLQGLMDTDGFISKDGSNIEFCTTSEQLKNDFVYLVQSLGGVCKIREKKPRYFNKKYNKKISGHLCYTIGIKLPKNISPFRLTRKIARLNKKALNPSRYITNIEYVADQYCQCIYIDSNEHLYLTNDFIVTHNTQMAVLAMLYLLYRMLCLKDPYGYYGMMPIDKITFSLLNITIDTAKGVAWDKLQQLLQNSEWFMAHGSLNASRVAPTWQPDKHIELIFGSSNNHVIGRALFCLDGETEILTANGVAKIKDLVNKPIQVWNLNNNNNKVLGPICTVKPTLTTNINYQISLTDGSVINCTADHLFKLTTGEYKKAKDLTIDDELAEPKLSYFEFIDNIIQTRGQFGLSNNIYWEGHHIIPKCFGGTGNSKHKDPNIIRLLPEEHYIAHKLLAEENPENKKLVAAFEMMIHPKGKTKHYKETSCRLRKSLQRTSNFSETTLGGKIGMKIKSIQKIVLPEEKQYYDVVDSGDFHNFLIKTNSSYIISHNCNMSDEVNFTAGNLKNIETQKKKLKKMIAQIDARMVSRFGKGTFLPTLNIIISSKDTEQSFLDDYIKRKEHDNKTLIIDEPQWTVRPDKGTPNDPGAFYVAVGGKMLAHELLPVDASEELVSSYRDKGYQMIKIPPIFRRDFETNLDQALMDIAGISSISAAKFLSGVRLKEAKTASYENPFTKDIIEVGDAPDDLLQYANFFDLSKVKPEDKSKPLFIHLDMSTGSKGKGDKTGIAGVWITGKTPTIPGQEDSLSLHYKLAFSVSIKAPKGYNISFIKNQNFIKWLREQGFAVKVVSADTYQSMPVLQGLNLAGFKTQIQSVDRVNSEKICEPYYYLKSAIYDRRVDIYDKCDLLTEELTNLEREASGKIEHPEGGKYGCFVGSTKVSLVDGREVSMTELVSEYEAGKINYVYSFNNKTKCIEPKPILKAWCTQQNASLIEVELDSGKVLTCTPNHRFMMRDGSYKEAQDLQVNDSLMPLYRKYPSTKAMSKYRMYYEPIEDKWHYEHRQFAYEILDEKHLVHHKNCNPSDNTPTNLVWCSKAKHIELHKIMSTGSCSDEAKAKRNASLRL